MGSRGGVRPPVHALSSETPCLHVSCGFLRGHGNLHLFWVAKFSQLASHLKKIGGSEVFVASQTFQFLLVQAGRTLIVLLSLQLSGFSMYLTAVHSMCKNHIFFFQDTLLSILNY